MFVLTPIQALVTGFVVAPSIFIACAYFTRASTRRVAGALAGAAAYGALNVLWDEVAFANGWWQYPAWSVLEPWWRLLYIPVGLIGGANALIGWRVLRRFGARGWLVFLGAWTLWGGLHDLGGSQLFASSNFMVFGSGVAPVLADLAEFASCAAL